MGYLFLSTEQGARFSFHEFLGNHIEPYNNLYLVLIVIASFRIRRDV